MHVKHITMSNKSLFSWVSECIQWLSMCFDILDIFREFLKIHEEFKYETKYLDYFH